jgi:hypothetical protein
MDKRPSLKALYWLGSSKRDLFSLPGPVEDLFGCAPYLTRDGRENIEAFRLTPKTKETVAAGGIIRADALERYAEIGKGGLGRFDHFFHRVQPLMRGPTLLVAVFVRDRRLIHASCF